MSIGGSGMSLDREFQSRIALEKNEYLYKLTCTSKWAVRVV